MYSVYEKQPKGRGYRYRFREKTSLFGCNAGWIPYLLERNLAKGSTEPLRWHLEIEQELIRDGHAGQTLVINLKPNSSKPNLSLYEVIEVWGHSDQGWTPIMFYLRGLFVDEDPAKFNSQEFVRENEAIEDPVFSMMYLKGTVRGGHIRDKWTPPGRSSTNSVLLWPETLNFFTGAASKVMRRAGCPKESQNKT